MKKSFFLNNSLLAMKSGFNTTILVEKDHGHNRMSQYRRSQRLNCIQRKSCYVYGIERTLCTTSCCYQAKTIDFTRYYSQLVKLKETIDRKRPEELANKKGVVFHDRPHISVKIWKKLLQFGWDVLVHPSCSPDLASSYYHIFV